MVHTYDPKQVAVTIGGQSASGFGDGTFVKFGRMEPMWNMKVGVDGEATRAKSNNKSGFIEITLMNSSSFNAYLSGITQADELSNNGAVPCLVNDKSGTDLATCLTGWVKQWPDREKAKEANTTTWRIETDNLQIFIGGN